MNFNIAQQWKSFGMTQIDFARAKVNTISEYNFIATFTYNSDNERARMVVSQGNNHVFTRWYTDNYTGHEHLSWFNLINMNGLAYDPLIGQFLSPDNIVQDPAFTRSYNRYIYCRNNPLKYTDPSGDTYLQYMEQHYEQFDYKGGYYSEGTCCQGTLSGGGYAPTTNTSYNTLHPEYEYNYDPYLGKYRSDLTGGVVEWEEVHNNYVVPNSSLTIDFHHPQNPGENSQQNNQNDPCGNDS